MTTRRDFLSYSARLAGAASLSAFVPSFAEAALDVGPIVNTQFGKVRGLTKHGVHQFKGIPYGGSVSGARRFLSPLPPQPWTQVRDAFEWGPTAPQSPRPRGPKQAEFIRVLSPANRNTAEDCLSLNVWTGGLDHGKRPVMVWLHGGGFDQGSGGAIGYSGFSLAKHHDVVAVTLNHRLNALGYLYLGEVLGGEFAEGANAGQQDIVLALKWIRDNIATFGGDPERVMIFGQSGGAGKVAALLGMPSAQGLFHAAALQSGAGGGMPRDLAHKNTEKTLETLGIAKSNARDLQKLPLEKLLAAFGMGGPVIDGKVLPASAIGSPVSKHVPVIVGWTRTERTFYDVDREDFGKVTKQDLLARTQVLVGAVHAKHVIGAYRERYPKAGAFALSRYIADDAAINRSIIFASERSKVAKTPTYVYRFDWETPVLNLLAPHTIDIPFVFNHLELCESMVGPATKPMQDLAMQVASAWSSLARHRDPNRDSNQRGLPHWPAYSVERKAVMIFNGTLNETSRVEIDPGADLRKLLIEDTLPKPRPG